VIDFLDFKKRLIKLESEAWDHIQLKHPGIKIDDIKSILSDPDVVQLDETSKPNSTCLDELFFHKQLNKGGKMRFILIVVRVCEDGNYISTSYICRKLKSYKIIYSKKEV